MRLVAVGQEAAYEIEQALVIQVDEPLESRDVAAVRTNHPIELLTSTR